MEKDNLHNNKSGFTIPDGYFESFDKNLSDKLFYAEEESELLKTKISSGFKTPDNYFNTLDASIVRKTITNKPKGKIFSLSNKQSLTYFSGIAAMIAILISVSINKKSELDFDDIEVADIYTYCIEGNIKLSSTDIISLLGNDISYVETFENELINDEILLDYLSEDYLEDEVIFTE